MTTKQTAKWDSPENEAQNNFVSWGKVDDYVFGTLIEIKDVKSTLPDKAGEIQKVYAIKIKEGSYHTVDEKKNPVEPPVVLQENDVVSIGGRKMIDSRMARVKIGQIFGLKYTEELDAKVKGYNATKLIKVFTPRKADNTFQMDQEFLDSQVADGDEAF